MRYFELIMEAVPTHPTFRKWFAGSVVVDAQGRPLRVFHGTNKLFDLPFREFTYFGSAEAANARIKRHTDNNTRLYPVFLNIRHPYIFKDTGMDENYDVLMAMYNDHIIDHPPNDIEPEFEDDSERNQHVADESKLIISTLARHGYDGVKFTNSSEDAGSTSWVPFSNNQIWTEFDTKD